MRAIILLPVLFLGGCSGNGPDSGNNQAAREPLYTVRAGPVANAQVGALAGTFQLLETGGPGSIPSTRIGGACLVFPATDLGFSQMAAKQCGKNSDCGTSENPVGYCDIDTKRCWSRPNQPNARPALCNVGNTLNPSELNNVPVQPVDVAQFNIAPGAKVRVIACINKTGANPTQTGCGSPDGPDRVEVMGPVATIR